jgi:PH (Pleckstrin Homology) domain-containing protein
MVDAPGRRRDPGATGATPGGHHQGVSEETTEAPTAAAPADEPGAAPEPPEDADSAATEDAAAGPEASGDAAAEPETAGDAAAEPETAGDADAEAAAEPETTGNPEAEAAAEPETTGDAEVEAAAAGSGAPVVVPRRLVFRVPASAYVVIAFLALCVSFVAVASPYATLVYLLPLAAVVWVARTRTEVDADRLVVRTVWFRTVLPWSSVASLRVAEKGWIRAVRTDGGEIALPSVRTRHLPALALISGGRLSDPTADRPDRS